MKECIHCMIPFMYRMKVGKINLWYIRAQDTGTLGEGVGAVGLWKECGAMTKLYYS